MSTPTLEVIPTNKIVAGEENPRGDVDRLSEAFAGLCVSLEERGILQPILVTPANGDGKHRIVAGHRRHAAAVEVKLKEVPAMVLDLEGAELLAALTENIQREDLSPVAEARAIEQLQKRHGLTQPQAGDALGKSERWVRDRLVLLSLPEKTQDAFDDGALPLEALRPVAKLAEQAPRAADALATAAADDEEIRKAVGADRVTEALTHLSREAVESGADLGCLVQVGGGGRFRWAVRLEQLERAGAPEDTLTTIRERVEESTKLRRRLPHSYGRPEEMWVEDDDRDAAESFGCLLEMDGVLYVTDAAWLADRFLQASDSEITELKVAVDEKQKSDRGNGGTPEKGSGDEQEEKEQRRLAREAEQEMRRETRAANLELGQRVEKALRAPKLTIDEARLLALLVVGHDASNLGDRGLVHAYRDYQNEEPLNNGQTRVTYAPGGEAGDALVEAIVAAKKPEEALGIALRSVLLAAFVDQECVAPSNRTHFELTHKAAVGIDDLLQSIAVGRKVLPDSIRKALEQRRQVQSEDTEIRLLTQTRESRAKNGVQRRMLGASDAELAAAVEARYLKEHEVEVGDETELSYTLNATGKKRLEKLVAAQKERQQA